MLINQYGCWLSWLQSCDTYKKAKYIVCQSFLFDYTATKRLFCFTFYTFIVQSDQWIRHSLNPIHHFVYTKFHFHIMKHYLGVQSATAEHQKTIDYSRHWVSTSAQAPVLIATHLVEKCCIEFWQLGCISHQHRNFTMQMKATTIQCMQRKPEIKNRPSQLHYLCFSQGSKYGIINFLNKRKKE